MNPATDNANVSEDESAPTRKIPMVVIVLWVFLSGLVLMIGLVIYSQATQPRPEPTFYYYPPAEPVLPTDVVEE